MPKMRTFLAHRLRYQGLDDPVDLVTVTGGIAHVHVTIGHQHDAAQRIGTPVAVHLVERPLQRRAGVGPLALVVQLRHRLLDLQPGVVVQRRERHQQRRGGGELDDRDVHVALEVGGRSP